VQDLNRFLRGWTGYFRYGNSAQFFDKISLYAGSRLNSPRLRAAESCRLKVIVLTSSRPSVGSTRKGEG
jgi:RNA-directed DNA polymerase